MCSRDTPKGALRRDSKLWGNYSLRFWIWECLLLGAVPLEQLIMGPMVLPTPIFPVCPQHCHLRCSLCVVQSSVYNSVRKGRCRLPSDITSSQAFYMYHNNHVSKYNKTLATCGMCINRIVVSLLNEHPSEHFMIGLCSKCYHGNCTCMYILVNIDLLLLLRQSLKHSRGNNSGILFCKFW